MKCLVIRHLAFEDLGLLGPLLVRCGFEILYREAGVDVVQAAHWQSADLVVVLGGPIGVGDMAVYPWLADEIHALRTRLSLGRPLLGMCLGAQLMAAALGARVYAGPSAEIAWSALTLSPSGQQSPLRHFAACPVLHWHGDTFDLPHGTASLASTALTSNQAFSVGPTALALQFHPEVDAQRFESWLVGHSVELRKHQIDVATLRQQAQQGVAERAAACAAFFDEWLAQAFRFKTPTP
jgi:GMP synthase (glutamine-hydrolysing)